MKVLELHKLLTDLIKDGHQDKNVKFAEGCQDFDIDYLLFCANSHDKIVYLKNDKGDY